MKVTFYNDKIWEKDNLNTQSFFTDHLYLKHVHNLWCTCYRLFWNWTRLTLHLPVGYLIGEELCGPELTPSTLLQPTVVVTCFSLLLFNILYLRFVGNFHYVFIVNIAKLLWPLFIERGYPCLTPSDSSGVWIRDHLLRSLSSLLSCWTAAWWKHSGNQRLYFKC